MKNVTVKWARNTAAVLGDAKVWKDITSVSEMDEVITLYRGDDLVAEFGRYDADVIVVDDA